MSCFICSGSHVAVLARVYVRKAFPHIQMKPCPNTEDEIATILHTDNVAAFVARYPGQSVDPVPFKEGTVDAFFKSASYDQSGLVFNGYHEPELGQHAKLLECYDYQLSDHPDYRNTESKRIVDRINDYLLHQLPGYEQARYSI